MLTIDRAWAHDIVTVSHESEVLFPPVPTIGLVIGTFAAVPYVHLQLESRKRFAPAAPVLVHDDGSHLSPELRALCEKYGADFESNRSRLPHHLGDLSAFYGGLKWAEHKSLDLLVKVSRRWIFLTDWLTDLRNLATASQYHTYSSHTTTFNFGFRTECMGMAVKRWAASGFYSDCIEQISLGRHVFVEAYVHQFARRLDASNAPAANRWRQHQASPPEQAGYARWDLIGDDRAKKSDTHLWHNANKPADYAALAQRWELPYGEIDFVDPNQGAGLGRAPA